MTANKYWSDDGYLVNRIEELEDEVAQLEIASWSAARIRNELWCEKRLNVYLCGLFWHFLEQEDSEKGGACIDRIVREAYRLAAKCPEQFPFCGRRTIETERRCPVCEWRIPREFIARGGVE